MNIAVYCGSRSGNKLIYEQAAKKLGQKIGSFGHTLVYGAGKVGIMGVLSDAVQESGGALVGVIPQFMVEKGWQRDGLDELIVTDSMSSRKAKMIELADLYIALPGGPGTMEEIAEAISLTSLGLQDKECVFLNLDGYYEPVKKMYEQMIEEGFSDGKTLQRLHFAESVEELEAFFAF